MKREIDMALECGSNKIIFGSGPDFPENRDEARKRLAGFILEAFKNVPPDVLVTIEPTGRDMDKFFLLGPFDESAEFAETLRAQGMKNFALLVDMGHVPLLGVSIENALSQSKGYIGHIHLGNCIVKNKQHPLYGDKHVPWEFAGGEYGKKDVVVFLRTLLNTGYLNPDTPNTVSFEMRPYEELGSRKSADRFIEIFEEAWNFIGE
jgi:sugar phosphate isomerase/epimerase